MSADQLARSQASSIQSGIALRLAGGPRISGSKPLSRQLLNTAAALAKIRAGTANGAIAFQGDSTSFGTNATLRAQDYLHRLAAILTAHGIPTETDSIWGFSALSGASLTAWDSRITLASWSGSTVSIAGIMFSDIASTTNLTFTPEKSVGVFDIFYPCDPQFGTIAVSIDGGTAQNILLSQKGGVWTWNGSAWSTTTAPGSASSAFGKAQLIVPVGAHTLSVARVSGNIKISGFHGYRTDIKQLALYNWGRSGETSVGWATGSTYWNYRGAAGTFIAPDLTILDLGINDANTAVTPATYSTNMQLLVNVPIANSKDIALMMPGPVNPATITLATQQALRDQVTALSVANSVPIIADMPQRWGEYTGGNGVGFYTGSSNDGIHPGDAGYADKAQAIARVLLSL